MTEEKTEDQEAVDLGQEFAEEIGQETKKITTKDTLKSVELNDAEVKVEKVDLKKVKADDLDAVTKDIYSEFNAFLETKADIKEDIGEKILIPTEIHKWLLKPLLILLKRCILKPLRSLFTLKVYMKK